MNAVVDIRFLRSLAASRVSEYQGCSGAGTASPTFFRQGGVPHSPSTFFGLKFVWAPGRCRISPPRFLAECCKRQLNQVSFVLLYFRLSTFSDLYWVCLSVFFCTVLFVSISQVIGCEDRLRNDLYCVEWGVKLCSNSNSVWRIKED